MAAVNDGNGRIRNADRLARIEERQIEAAADNADLRAYLTRVLDQHDARIRAVETDVARQGERLTLWAGLQAALTGAAATVAALIGRQP